MEPRETRLRRGFLVPEELEEFGYLRDQAQILDTAHMKHTSCFEAWKLMGALRG